MAQGLPGARLYLLLVRIGVPLRWWCRLEIRGRELLPPAGTGVLVVSNHDSWLDPLVLGDTLMRAGRPLRFVAKDTLWKIRPVAWILDGVRQIPIRRGAGDAGALDAAVAALEDGEAICIFPEGTLSRGRRLRARRGVARIAQAAPEVPIVLAAVRGGTELLLFPRRPRVHLELFAPAGGPARADEDAAALASRLMAEIRERIPPVPVARRASGRSAPGPAEAEAGEMDPAASSVR